VECIKNLILRGSNQSTDYKIPGLVNLGDEIAAALEAPLINVELDIEGLFLLLIMTGTGPS